MAGDGDEITVELADATAIVTLRGEIDANLAARLLDVAFGDEVAGRSVLVDLAEVTFMDSTAISFLLRLRSIATGRVRLLNAGQFPRQLLEVAGVDHLFDLDEHGVPADG